MSQHLHVLHCVANSKTISSLLAKNNLMDQFVNILNRKKALSPALLKTALVYFICDADLPLSITKSPASQALLELCNPAVTNILVRRASLTLHLTNIYFCHEESICNYLSTNNINVSLTTDAWTSPNITAYLVVTVHCIDADFKLTSILLGLCQIEGNHLGASLSSQFLTIIQRFNLDQKIICITTDNASVNHCMPLGIESIFPCFCSKDHAVGCMAHTIHLAACDGLKALGSDTGDTPTPVDHNDLNQMAISSLTNSPNGLNLQYNSIIGKISQLASYLHHSPQRREKFITTVNLVYDTDKTTNAKTLLMQVPTRWHSTYKMLNRALDLKDAYNHFCTPKSLASYRLSHLE
ncbi:hypothetical protein O181_020187 [Austropuccinia psidii MF-1]|uniref:Uncharacterized protein n=1 Tax=Austropuccinia psidii MF-1 TaxID=1389203 RepID=A0A9Q3CB80_9BASI|nr:hypothetical protein [Austropuccinia psidii MF-1]